MGTNHNTTVQCYSGHTYAQEPHAFSKGTEHHAITQIRKQWREPAGPCFAVLADDGATYLLAYDETTDNWHVSAWGCHPAAGHSGMTTTLQMEEDGQR